MNKGTTAEELRNKHPRFVYQKFSWQQLEDELVIEFNFLLEPDITFKPEIKIFPIEPAVLEKVGRERVDQWVFNLGMIELFSYWKAAASPEIVVKAGVLSDAQLAWWKQLLINGMGEFFYTNDLDFTQPDFVTIVNEGVSEPSLGKTSATKSNAPRYLVPCGGGKDSALVIELLEENGLEYDVLLSHPQSPAAAKMAKLSRAGKIIHVGRSFDPQLFELNKAGYLNGHTPFSARLAFESGLVGLLLGHSQILLGNEFSANEGNVPFHGTTVNHQYSKTFDFEQQFRDYASQYLSPALTPAPEYLSLLRPLTELQIAAAFANYPRYHQLFKSCNRDQQEEQWCCQCPKCLFVFTILYPFLEESELVGLIFPENLFAKPSLNPMVLAMLGKDEHKPFECIGTYEETLAAFQLSIERFQANHPSKPLPPVLEFVQQEVLSKEPAIDAAQALCAWNDQHHLDERLLPIVKAAQKRVCDR